jgi:ligand-binding SRPBCC domain-containing protein
MGLVNMSSKLKRYIFQKRTRFNVSLAQLIAFHENPSNLPKLTPPPIFIHIQRDNRSSLSEGEIEFTLWFGPFPVTWLALHEPGPTGHSFADLALNSPLDYWRHEHIFEQLENGVALVDRVSYAHKPGFRGIVTRLFFGKIPLVILFNYRHLQTQIAMKSQDNP